MARKSGIPQSRLSRISEELGKARQGDFGAPSKYEEALFGRGKEPTPPSPVSSPEPEDRLSTATISDLCSMLGISYSHCFEEYSPVLSSINGESTRVRTMKFEPDDDLREVLLQIVQSSAGEDATKALESENWYKIRISQTEVYKMIPGTITVTWVNGKPAWEYWNITLSDYMDFRQSPSPGRHLNTHLRSASKGPL